jgi:hypothetical protein
MRACVARISAINIMFHENVVRFKYLGTTLTNQNKCGKIQILGDDTNKSEYIHDEIKTSLNSVNAYYHSVQNLLSSRLT